MLDEIPLEIFVDSWTGPSSDSCIKCKLLPKSTLAPWSSLMTYATNLHLIIRNFH